MKQPRWLGDARGGVVEPEGPGLNILVFDIETAPEANWTWGRFKTNTIGNLRPDYMLSFAYTWYGSGAYHFIGQQDNPAYIPDNLYGKPRPTQDRWVVSRLWHLMDMADVLVAHNGDKFDIPYAQGRFRYYDLAPTRQFASVDTLKVHRKHFRYASNSLNELSVKLLNETKVANYGIGTWLGCMAGDFEMWSIMRKYNLRDITLLEDLYTGARPWVTRRKNLPVPNANDYRDRIEPICPVPGCGGTKILTVGVTPPSSAGLVYREWECQHCGGKFTSNYAERTNTPTRDRIK